MVFRRRYQAQKFINLIASDFSRISIILRVEVFEKGKCPKYVSRWTTQENDLNWFYNKRYVNKKYMSVGSGFDLLAPPIGTLCYYKVKVID
jgi:hypothetical protein